MQFIIMLKYNMNIIFISSKTIFRSWLRRLSGFN